MKIVRLLEDKTVIRGFGVCLLLAPIINTYIFIITSQEYSQSLSITLFWKILFAGAFIEKLLSTLGLLLGMGMLSGSVHFWKWVFGYLGLFILYQIMNLGTNLRTSWIHGVFFIGNIGTFLFIADQLIWKAKPLAPPVGRPVDSIPNKENFHQPDRQVNSKFSSELKPNGNPLRGPRKRIQYFTKKVYISIPGLGKSGQITGLSRETLSLRLDRFPQNLKLHSRFEFVIQKVSVRAKVESIDHQDIVLRFETESIPFHRAIAQWQKSLS